MPIAVCLASTSGSDQLGQAEVEQLDEVGAPALVGEEDVARPQIAVHVAEPVRLRSAPRRSATGCRRRARRRAGLLALDHLGERLALEELHGEEEALVVGAPEVEHLQDVLVVQLATVVASRRKRSSAVSSVESCACSTLTATFLLQRRVLAAIDGARAALPDLLDAAGSDRAMTLPIIGSFADGAMTGAPQRGQKRASSGVRRAALRAVPHDRKPSAHQKRPPTVSVAPPSSRRHRHRRRAACARGGRSRTAPPTRPRPRCRGSTSSPRLPACCTRQGRSVLGSAELQVGLPSMASERRADGDADHADHQRA